MALLILISPFVDISDIFKELFYIISALIILGATVDISKKKKQEDGGTMVK